MKTIEIENFQNNKCVITGVAGFIGSHLASYMLLQGYTVIGIDCITDYYDMQLKHKRLDEMYRFANFCFYKEDIADEIKLQAIVSNHQPDIVIHLAAQAGVVMKDDLLQSYLHSNLKGFESVIKICYKNHIPLLYASSSSVYGNSSSIPFSERQTCLTPLSLYAGTKLLNEQTANFYNNFLNLTTVGLRFFSVYGEDMRPDMAISKFSKAILSGTPITLYGDENTARDFTYIDDVVRAIILIINRVLKKQQVELVYNIGCQTPIRVRRIIEILDSLLKKNTIVYHKPLREGEASITCSDSSLLYRDFLFVPKINIKDGLMRYVSWLTSHN